MTFKCPGSHGFIQPKPELFKCPHCGEEVEIWTDEIKAVCPNCKRAVMKNSENSCLDWCKYAKECVGEKIYLRYMGNKLVNTKYKLLKELKEYFKDDIKRINHARNVMKFAEEIMEKEKADWHIVIPASILHDIGVKAAEAKYGSSKSCYQEKEGPPIARDILLRMGLKREDIDEICEIIANHHTPGKINTQNFKVLYDADLLVNLSDKLNSYDKKKLKDLINKDFLTRTGKKIAKKNFGLTC